MNRIESEREVMATLLLRPAAYHELPDEFTEGWFETFDYRALFSALVSLRTANEGEVNSSCLERQYPEFKALIQDVTWAAVPLNGAFRIRAKALRFQSSTPLETRDASSSHQERRQTDEDFHFQLYTGMEIVKMDIPKQSFLIKDLLSEHSINFLSGEEGSGKSLMAMNLALSIAIGAEKWLEYEIVKHGKVVYLNNELAFTDFARRLKTMGNRLPATGDISNLIIPKEVPALTECWQTLNELCKKERPCLIVIDTLYFAHNKDENDSSDMKELMRQFISLRDQYGLAVLLVHHTKKGANQQRMHNDQMRGSNVFGGVTDTVLQFRRSSLDETKRIMKPTKFRHVSDENRKCRLLSLDGESLWFRDEGETDEDEHITKLVPTAEQEIDFGEIFGSDKELSRKQILERCSPLGYDERTIDRIVKKAMSKSTLTKGVKYGTYAL